MARFTPSDRFRKKVAMIESGGNPKAKNPKSSAKGLYQFVDKTAMQYGLDDPFDPAKATKAFDALAADNYATLEKKLGRAPTEAELYLAHQQGAGGAAKLLENPDAMAVDVVGEKQVLLNGGSADMTAEQYAAMWGDKYEAAPEPDAIDAGTYLAERTPQPLQPAQMTAQADTGVMSDALDFSDVSIPADAVLDFSENSLVPEQKQNFPRGSIVPAPEKSGDWRTFFDQYLQGATGNFADEITDPLGAVYAAALENPSALLTGEVSDPFLAEQIAGARESTEARLAQQRKDSPWITAAGNIAGAVVGSAGALKAAKAITPAKAASAVAAAAKANPLKSAALLGAGGNALYAAGEVGGDIENRLAATPIPAAVGAVAAPLGYKLAQGATNLVRTARQSNIGQKVGEFVDDFINPPPSAAPTAASPVGQSPTAMQMAGIFDENDLARLEKGRVLPLTKGDRTQDVVTQRMEEIASKAGSAKMLNARSAQQEATYKPFVNALGKEQPLDPISIGARTQEEVEQAANILRKQYDTLGLNVNRAYEKAREIGGGVGIKAEAIHKDFLGGVDEILTFENVRKGDIPKLDSVTDELRDIIAPMYGEERKAFSTNAMNLNALEAWKKRLNRVIGNTAEPADKRILEAVGRKYDEFLTNLADDAIVNGDETAIAAFKNARSLAREKFAFYDADKQVAKILDNRALSGENLVNTVYGASRISSKGDDGTLIPKMLRLAGDRAPEMQAALKRGALSKILTASVSGTTDPATVTTDAARKMISFANMKKQLGSLMQQKEIFNSIFDDTERKYFSQMYKDLDLIASRQAGAVNNSSTGSYLATFIEGMGKIVNNPVMKMVPVGGAATTAFQKFMSEQAASIVTGKAEKGLNEFAELAAKALSEVDTPAIYYGSIGGARAVDEASMFFENEDEEQQ